MYIHSFSCSVGQRSFVSELKEKEKTRLIESCLTNIDMWTDTSIDRAGRRRR